MDLKTLQDEMKTAMKAGDSVKLGTLRMLIAEIKKREIDKRTALDESEIQKVISTLVKQRLESVEAFTKGNRPELAEKEQHEADFLKSYLPQMMGRPETETLVSEAIREVSATGPNDIGKVMKAALAKAGGKADGKLINEIARALLTKA